MNKQEVGRYPNEDVDALCKQKPNLRILFKEARDAGMLIAQLQAQLERAQQRYDAADGAAHAYRQELQRMRDEEHAL